MPLIPLVLRNSLRHEVDGGWAWVVVAASFMIQTILFGIIQSYGTMFVALLDDFKSGEYETAWIGSMGYGLTFFIGPIYAALSEHFGCRKMVYCGTLICMVSCFSSSFAPNLSTLYFTFGILWGIGAGMTFFPCLLVLNFYFSNRISLANGITMAGSAIGTLIFNASLNRILELYGWRVGFRLFGGVCALMFVCGTAYLPPPQDFYAIQEWEQYQKVKLTTKLARIFDIRPWKEKAFVVWLIGVSFVLFGYFIPYVHLVRFGETLNVPLSQSTLLVGYMSISQIFAKLICGKLADMRRVKRLQILIISILSFSICNFAVTSATDFTGLLTYALFYGFFDGLFVVVLPILIRDLVGRELMANAIGNFYGVVSIPLTAGPPISGQLYDVFGSYKAPFSVAGGLMLIASFMMYFVYRLKPELLKDLPLEGEDTFTSDLIARPSIHSHTVDALSGMFLTERFSTIDSVDRPSQLTINPLHNFASVLTRSRAGSTISGRTGQRFPSFSIDMRSDGGSEIFLQRLRGYGDGASVVSSAHGKDLTGSTSTAPSDDILSSTKDSSLDRVSHGNVAFASSVNKMSTATLANESNTDVTPSSCYNEVGNLAEINHSMDKCMVRIVEPGEDSSPEKIQHEQTENITSSGMEEEEDSAKQDNLARNLEDDKIDTSLELIQISASEELNSGSTILDTNMKGLTQISEVAQIDDLSPDIDILADRTSSPIPKSFESGPTSPLITLGIDESFTEEADITLVPADNIDNETTTETIVPDDIERSTDESCEDEVLIRIPPPPTWNREVPLVDLTEDGETEELASRSSSTDVQSSTDFLCLNERLKIMAEQQKREGELRMRFPTDEMTLFATYRSNIATPSEQQSTPVFETIPQTPAPSENQSPPKTPSQVNVPLEALTLQHNGMPLHIIPCPVNENGMDTHQLSDDILEPCAIPPSDHLISKQFAQFLPGENIEQKVQQNSSSIPEAQNSSQREPFLSIGNAHRDSQSDSHVIKQQTVNMQVISRDSQYISQQRTMENNIMHQQTQSSPEHHTLLTERDTAPIAAKSQFEDESTTHQFTTQLYENENIEQLQSTQTYPQVKCTATDNANINDLLLIDMTSSSTNNLGEYATNPFLQEMNNCNYSTLQHHTSADQMAKLISTDNLSNNTPHTPPSATEKHQHQRIVNDNILSQTTPEVKELESASTDDESKDTCLQIILTPTIVDEDPRDDMIQLKDTYTTELELTSASTTTNNDLIDMTSVFPDSKPEEEWTSNQNTVHSTHLCPELEMTLGSTSFKDINDLLKITTTSDSTDNQLFEESTLSPLLQESHPSDRTDESAQECVPASCKSDSKIKKGIIQTAVFENNAPPGECIENVFLNTNNDCNSALPMHLSTSAVEKADDYVSANMQSTSPNSMDTENKEDCGIRFLNDTSSSIDNYRNDTIQTNLVIASADKNNEEACIQRFNADNMQRATRFHEQQHAYVSTGGKTHDDADMKITSACDSADFNFAVERNTNPFLKETIGGDRIIQLSQTHPETKVSTGSTVSPFNSSHVLHPNVSGKEDCSTNSSQQKAFVGDSSTKPPEIKTSAEVATLVSTDNSCKDTLLQISLDPNDGKIKYEEDLTATSLQQRFDNIQQLETLCLFSENVKKCNDCTGTTYTSADSKSEEYVETNPFLEKRIDDEQSRHTTPPEATSDVQATYAPNTNNDDLKRISTTCASVSQFGRCTNLVISHFNEKDKTKHLCTEVLICKERCSSSDSIPNNYVIAPTGSGNGLNDKCTIPFPKQSSNNTDNPELQATCIPGEITSNEKNIQKIEETPSSTETIRNPFMQDQGTNAEYLDYCVWAVKGSLDSESVVTNERKDIGGSRNPFVSEGACLQDNQEQSFLIPSRPDMIDSNYKSSAISVPITLDRQVYRRKSVVIDDNSDCDKSNSNSLVNVFELELDEHDKGNTDKTGRNQDREKSQKFNEETSDNME